jgi:hypothetical protein
MSPRSDSNQGPSDVCPVCGGRQEAEAQIDDVQFIVACPRCNNGDRDEWELLCGPLGSRGETEHSPQQL